jgi:hypothetical protein
LILIKEALVTRLEGYAYGVVPKIARSKFIALHKSHRPPPNGDGRRKA